MIPVIDVGGDAGEQGRQYGEATRERVGRSRELYEEVFGATAGWTWAQAVEHAARFRAPIAAYSARFLEEIEGIAEGAGLRTGDVLAMNVRTEIMFAAGARKALAAGTLPPECSSFAVEAHRTRDGALLMGENWDWLSASSDTVVTLRGEQADGPNYVTVVEAGLLAKAGLNQAGVGVATNALISGSDAGEPGVPYHVLLRALLDSRTVSDAAVALTRSPRASSANYLVAQDGVALDYEAAPGNYARVGIRAPHEGLLWHTNHFLEPRLAADDVAVHAFPDSHFRLQRLGQLAATHSGPYERRDLEAMLADHATHPAGICAHATAGDPAPESWETVAAIVMEPSSRRMWLAAGTPCQAPFEPVDCGELLRPDEAADGASTTA